MCSFEWKAILASALVFVAVIDPDRGLAQPNVSSTEIDHQSWVPASSCWRLGCRRCRR